MNPLRFAARSGGRAPFPFAAIAFSIGALLAVTVAAACGGDDDDDASKGFIGTNYPEPPRLGPHDADAGSPSAQSAPSSAPAR